jgi:hypothetical protein
MNSSRNSEISHKELIEHIGTRHPVKSYDKEEGTV